MCPFCLASMGLFVAGVSSTGGLAALAVKLSRKKPSTKEMNSKSSERSSEDVNANRR
jgi:hypothetical protein